jgi:hypothetical protein
MLSGSVVFRHLLPYPIRLDRLSFPFTICTRVCLTSTFQLDVLQQPICQDERQMAFAAHLIGMLHILACSGDR